MRGDPAGHACHDPRSRRPRRLTEERGHMHRSTGQRMGRRVGIGIGLVVALAITAGACSKDDTTSTSGGTTTAAPGTTAAGGVTTSGAPANTIPKADVLAMQQMLDEVG